MNQPILYIAACLPSFSETFVYNELLALRDRGVRTMTASVHTPARGLGSARVDALTDEVITVYGRGALRLLADALVEFAGSPGHTLRTLARGLFDAVRSPDVKLARRPKVIWQALAALALARRVRSSKPGHIHAHMAHVPTTIAMYAARQLGITFSFTGHANDLFPERTLLPEKLRRASFVACISHWHRDFYRGLVDLPDERLPIVRCGVEVPETPSVERGRDRTPTIVAVGRLIPKKGFDVLIHAVARLVGAGRALCCHIIGDGPQQVELVALVRKLKLSKHVQLIGPQSNRAVQTMLTEADLFVLPCRVAPDGDRDGIPVVLMEAMAAGVCVVSGDLPAIRELVQHEKTGLLVPPDDADALTAVIQKALDNPDLRQRLGQQGRQWVAAEFSLQRNIDRLIAAFRVSAQSGNATEELNTERPLTRLPGFRAMAETTSRRANLQ